MAADNRGVGHSVFTIPALVGLLVASLFAPRSLPSGAPAQGPSASAPGAAAPSTARNTRDYLTADDLLAEYFGVNARSPSLHAAVAAAAARHKTRLHFLIATVADPIDSYETWHFDPEVDAIRQGIEASGFLFDRFYLPSTGIDPKTAADKAALLRELHQHWPGIILFRWNRGSKAAPPDGADEQSLLITFLIPETPVAGIHQEPFNAALTFAHAWAVEHPALTSVGDGIRILGPTYSGSTQSVLRGLLNFDAELAPARATGAAEVPVTIISGSASNDGNRKAFEVEKKSEFTVLRVSFHATMQSNAAIDRGLSLFLESQGIEGNVASLTESSTAYGNDVSGQQAGLHIKFPFNVAQLRRDANRNGAARDGGTGGLMAVRPLSLDDATVPTDQFPLQAPATTSSSVELVLANMLDAVRREHVRIVRLDSTDIRDKLFVIKELRERAPDVLVVSTDADLFQVHPDQARWLRGLLVASTYPLHTSGQDLVYPYHGLQSAPRPNGELVQFSSVNMQGYYNAAIALLNYRITGEPFPRFLPGSRDDYATLPKLLDYGGIGTGCGLVGEPAIWISVVGDGQIVPLRSYCKVDSSLPDAGYVFTPHFSPGTSKAASIHDLYASTATILLIVLVLAVSVLVSGRSFIRARRFGSARVGAQALALTGALVPISTLGIVVAFAGWEFVLGGRPVASTLAALGALMCLAFVVYALAFQVRSRTLIPVRLFFIGIAALSVTYVVTEIGVVPQFFLLRTLDIGTRMSPLLPLVAFGGVATVLAGVETWRLRAFGVGIRKFDGDARKRTAQESAYDYRISWKNCLDSIDTEATGGLEGIADILIDSHSQLFLLPAGDKGRHLAWVAAPFVIALISYGVMFPSVLRPILSVEGPIFGWTLALVVVFLQWVFATSLTQFIYLSCGTAQLLTRLGRHPRGLPWGEVPKTLTPSGLVPKAPRLQEMVCLAGDIPGGFETLQADLRVRPVKRWFRSDTWNAVNAEVARLRSGGAGIGAGERARRISAIKVVFVVRELLSRLSFNVLTMGPLLGLLIVLYWTVYFDRSHALLGLIWTDVLLAMAAIMSVFIWMDRDAVISGIRGTTPGQIDWNWDFVWKILVYVVLPLLTLFATQFPDVGSSLLRLVEPVQRLPGT